MFSMVLDQKSKQFFKNFKKLKERAELFKKALAFNASKYLYKLLIKNFMLSKDLKQYIPDLALVMVNDSSSRSQMYAITIQAQQRKIKNINKSKTIIKIIAKKRLSKKDPKVTILEKYSPWTLDTLPFLPDKSMAITVTTTVSEAFNIKVKKDRQRDSIQWKRDLSKLGVTFGDKLNLGNKKSVQDIVYEALSHELGFFSSDAAKQWTRSVKELGSIGINSIMKEKKLVNIFTSHSVDSYLSEINQVKKRITFAEAKQLTYFQKKIGLAI